MAVAALMHVRRVLAQDEYPAMEPPTDYIEQQRQQQETTCAITGLCNQQVQPGGRPVIYEKWTALAISDTTKRAGASHGQDSEAAARQLALTNCRHNGSTDCKFLLSRANTCIAIAISHPDGAYGWDLDSDRAKAGTKALARCRIGGAKNCGDQAAPCAGDDPRWPLPLPSPQAPAGRTAEVDPRTVGTWEIAINPGRWVWRINRDGTYEFHSEAADGAVPHAGTFSAHDGHWSLHATNGYTDEGTCVFQSPDVLTATGRLGTGSWRHSQSADN
jgi:hypothetical protein